MRFEFATATRIIFGAGTLREVGAAALQILDETLVPDSAAEQASSGGPPSVVPCKRSSTKRRIFVTHGQSTRRVRPLLELLASHGLEAVPFSVTDEPDLAMAQTGASLARDRECGLVIALGGGSVIDTAKAVSALATNPGDILDYLEVIGKARPLTRVPLPCIAIPTTAGTGAEVTRNSVLASPEHRVKVSLRSPLMLPRLAVIDPELTHELPPAVTASTGLDALTQLIEAFVSVRASALTDGICREGIVRAARALPRAFANGQDAAAREDMAVASLFGGLALANAGLGAVHGFAGPIGGMFAAPHGAVCAALLPHVIESNVLALRQRKPEDQALARYEQVARLVADNASATADDLIRWVRQLCRDLGIAPLSAYGMGRRDLPELVEKAQAASSMKGNPIVLTREELVRILEQALF